MKTPALKRLPSYRRSVLVVMVLLGCGCGTVRLPDAGEYTPPTIEVFMPGSDLRAAYGSFVAVDQLREGDEQVAVFSDANFQRGFSVLAVAKDIQTGVRRVTLEAVLTFRCRVRPSGGDRDFGVTKQSENWDRIGTPGSGDEVRRARETAVTFRLAEADQVCVSNGLSEVRGAIAATITVSATNYFDLTDTKVYNVQFRR